MKTKLARDYKVFEGRYNQQMPLLVNEGLTPLTSKDEDEISFWLNQNQYFDTVDGLAYHKGSLIVIPNSQDLLNINQDSKLNSGSLVLTEEQYKKLSKENEVIKRSKINSGESLTKKEAKTHPVWLKLAQEDKHLLDEYTEAIFAKAMEAYGYDKNMRVCLPKDQENPVMLVWYLRDLYGGSNADARSNLDLDFYHLLGVRAQNLEEVLGKIAIESKLTNPSELKKAIEFYRTAKQGKVNLKLLQ